MDLVKCSGCLWIFFTMSASRATFSGPVDTDILQGGSKTLYCSDDTYTGGGLALWRETGGPTFASQTTGVLSGAGYEKYQNFQIVSSSASQMDLLIRNADVSDEGNYVCEIDGITGDAELKIEIKGSVPTIIGDGDAPGSSFILTESVESVLRCTATGYRPAVTLEWYRNDVKVTAGITEDPPTPSGDTFETSGTLTFTPTRQDVSLECRTTGQSEVNPQVGALNPLNVQFPPYVTVTYSGGQITCSADANPLATSYRIILNETEVLQTFTTSGQSVAYKPDFCTTVTCNATNTLGTRTGTVSVNPLCPEAAPHVGAIVGAVVAAFMAGVIASSLIIFCLLRRRRHQETGTRGHQKTTEHDGDYFAKDDPHQMTPQQPETKKHRDIPLTEPGSGVVYESIPENDAVKTSQASVDVAYGNVARDLSFPRDLVIIENELGRGAFGRVLLGTALGIEETGKRTKVAVKTLKEGAGSQAKMELLEELELMKKVGSHPNVVRLLGYCKETDPVYVIVEYLGKGDLKKVLIECRDKDSGSGYSNLPGHSKSLSRTLVAFARDVAGGMAFLSSQKCVHRDLAARNVLVGDDMVCKVSDFGLARDVMNIRIYQRQSEGPLPMRWMALESLLDDVYTTESDVWSFGILLWEIVTLGARPYPLMKAKTMVNQLKQGYRMPKPQHCNRQLYAMMCSCWQESPQDRPTFQSLRQQLDEMMSQDKDYISLQKLDESIYEVTMIEGKNEKV